MAPSPTGLLHIGGVRTFLFNWLYARGRGGECLLRIENTDPSREVEESVEQIARSLRWLGIEWDGETTFQLDVMERAAGGGAPARRRRNCVRGRGRDPHPHARRRRPPAGTTRSRGASRCRTPSSRTSSSCARTAVRPTTSPRRSRTGSTASRMSSEATTTSRTRRSRSTSCARSAPSRPCTRTSRTCSAPTARSCRSATARCRSTSSALPGYVPEALMNFLALLGWAPDGETTIMSAGGARRALQSRARRLEPRDLRLREARLDERHVPPRAPRRANTPTGSSRSSASRVSTGRTTASGPPRRSCRRRSARLGEFPEFAGFLFGDVEPDPALLDKRGSRRRRERTSGRRAVDGRGTIEAALKQLCDELGEKPRTVYLPIRVAVTGSRVSPGLYESLELLGRATPRSRGSGRARRAAS